jgi:enterochelin esterase family protein
VPELNPRRSAWILTLPLVVLLLSACGLAAPASQTAIPATAVIPSPKPLITERPTVEPTFTTQPSATLLPTQTVTPMPPVTLESLPVPSLYLGDSRVLTIYLPPDYNTHPQQRFKVLYVNDGQDLAAISMAQILRGYMLNQQLAQIIVVGIPSSANRQNEYGTGSIPSDSGLGLRAQDYTNFLLKEVLPLVNSKYRLLSGPENVGIMGWSLGGLSAFYTAWTHPEVFGMVGAFSGSFWWRTSASNLPELLASRVVHKLVRESSNKPALRMWFSAGTAEFDQDRDKNGVIDMVQDTTDLLAELGKKGYRNGVDYMYIQIEGGTHDLTTWVKVLPDFLRWSFPAQ